MQEKSEASMRKLLVTILFFAAAASASARELTETIDKTFDVRAGVTFTLDNVNGRVDVSSWDQPRVRVHAVKTATGWDSDDVKKGLTELRVDIQASPDRIAVKTVEPEHEFGFFDFLFGHHVNRNVHYEITVPRTTNLDVSTVNGSIHVNSVSGSLRIETTNGKIEMARCAGSVDASTTNGGIHAELVTVTPGKAMRFETTNGHITITVPPNIAVEIDAANTNGSISTDLPVTTKDFEHHTLRGSVNGGGGLLKLRTTNGGIDIRTSSASQASR